MVDHSKWQARKEVLEGILAQNVDISAELEIAKAKEEKAWKLAFLDEDSKGEGGSGVDDSLGEKAAPEED